MSGSLDELAAAAPSPQEVEAEPDQMIRRRRRRRSQPASDSNSDENLAEMAKRIDNFDRAFPADGDRGQERSQRDGCVHDAISDVSGIPIVPVHLDPFPATTPAMHCDSFNADEIGPVGDFGNIIFEDPNLASKIRKDETAGCCQLGLEHVVDSSYESFNYNETSSFLRRFKDGFANSDLLSRDRYIAFKRYFIGFLIGPLTALVAVAIEEGISRLAKIKYGYLSGYFNGAFRGKVSFFVPLAFSVCFNLTFGFLAAMCVWISPIAQGSGIPQVKCYLNGVKVPHLVRIKTLLCKSFGVVFSVVGGYAVGKEGPMIHSGAAIGAGISQGKSTSMRFTTSVFEEFRTDQEKRDFVACGAAAGVAAAFGSPMGGILFAIEEGASHVNQDMLWRVALCSGTSYATLSIVKSFILGVPGQLSSGGLINFGKFDNAVYNVYEVYVFIIIGLIGALSGILFNALNKRITLYRLRYMHFSKIYKVVEVLCCGFVIAASVFLIVNEDEECQNIVPETARREGHAPFVLGCPFGKVNSAANLWYKTPESVVRSLFHDEINTHQMGTLLTFAAMYWLLACWTYGMGISSGLFVPSLLTGAAWGRCVGIVLHTYFYWIDWGDVGKYALIGACAQLAGNVRLTYSLTAIVMEATGNLTYVFPILVTVIITKHVGDFFNRGIYDTHIELMGIPMMEPEPQVKARHVSAMHVMASPVRVLPVRVKVKDAIHVLKTTTHNAFPIVDTLPKLGLRIPSYGRLRGLMTRHDVISMIKKRIFYNAAEDRGGFVRESHSKLRETYPRYPPIESVNVSGLDGEMRELDFSLAMDSAPIAVKTSMTFVATYSLMRNLGVRHIVVTNCDGEVVGMITRKNLVTLDLGRDDDNDVPVLKSKPCFFPINRTVPGYSNPFTYLLGIRSSSSAGQLLEDETE